MKYPQHLLGGFIVPRGYILITCMIALIFLSSHQEVDICCFNWNISTISWIVMRFSERAGSPQDKQLWWSSNITSRSRDPLRGHFSVAFLMELHSLFWTGMICSGHRGTAGTCLDGAQWNLGVRPHCFSKVSTISLQAEAGIPWKFEIHIKICFWFELLMPNEQSVCNLQNWMAI